MRCGIRNRKVAAAERGGSAVGSRGYGGAQIHVGGEAFRVQIAHRERPVEMYPDRAASLRFEHRHLAKDRGLVVQVGRELLQKVERPDRTGRIWRAFAAARGTYERHHV